jgi:hypothetical protein
MQDPDACANAILGTDYELNKKDARDLTAPARSIELDFGKNDRNVLLLRLPKDPDGLERTTKRIRAPVAVAVQKVRPSVARHVRSRCD